MWRAARRHSGKIWLTLLVLTVVWLASWDGVTHHREAFHTGDSDRIVALQSSVGYLKRKLAAQGAGPEEGKVVRDDPGLPMVYVVTPTYYRPVQKAELTRLCHTFLLVPNLHWIVVEDARAKTELVTRHLRECGVSFTHLFAQTPKDWKLQEGTVFVNNLIKQN